MTATLLTTPITTATAGAPEYLTTQEVATRYRVSDETVRRHNARLRPVRVGRQWRYDRRQVEAVFGGNWN